MKYLNRTFNISVLVLKVILAFACLLATVWLGTSNKDKTVLIISFIEGLQRIFIALTKNRLDFSKVFSFQNVNYIYFKIFIQQVVWKYFFLCLSFLISNYHKILESNHFSQNISKWKFSPRESLLADWHETFFIDEPFFTNVPFPRKWTPQMENNLFLFSNRNVRLSLSRFIKFFCGSKTFNSNRQKQLRSLKSLDYQFQ